MYSSKIDKDKFYTKEAVALECLSLLDLDSYDLIIEPSAGSGSFSKNITDVVALDLEPEDVNIIKQDWFEFETPKVYEQLLVVGNPPFGKRNTLSKAFISKAISLQAITIAFILPNVYNKHTLQKVFPKTYKLQKVWELPKDSFMINDIAYHVPCSFYIWNKTNEGVDLRFNPGAYTTNDFEFTTTPTKDCFFVLGASPSTVKEIQEVNKNNRGYYIKPVNKSKKDLTLLFKKCIFKGNSGANGGVSWRTKPEIIKGYLEEIQT